MLGAFAMPAYAEATSATLPAPVESCLRDNAAKVEAGVPDINQAVSYLVNGLCAVPIAEEHARQIKVIADKQAERMKAMCASTRKSEAAASGEDEEGVCAANYDASDWSDAYVTGLSMQQGANMPAATALASQLLLDLRISHSKSGSSH
jgi:hypothetical protein